MKEIVGQVKLTTTNHTKGSLHSKVMCVWWGQERILYYELLPGSQMINSNKYSSQLGQLKMQLEEKCLELVNRKCIIFQQDNARARVSLVTRRKLLQLGWEVLIHLLCPPDIAPSGVHLFRSLQNSLHEKISFPWKSLKKHLEQFFAQKDEKFWEDGIMKLLKNGRRQRNKMLKMFNKVLAENEKCIFYFYF